MISNALYLIPFKKLLIFIVLLEGTMGSTASNGSATNDTKEMLKLVIKKFQNEFEMIKNEELQVPLINNLYGSIKFLNKHVDPQKKVDEIAEKLMFNIDSIHIALEKAEDSFKTHNGNGTVLAKNVQSLIMPCKDAYSGDILSKIGESLSNHSSKYSINHILSNLFYDLWSMRSFIKQVFYLSLTDSPPFEDPATNNCCGIEHSILWRTYMSHNTYRTRRVIVLIDHGNTIDDNVLTLSKLFAKQMISVMNEEDKFTVIAIASKWSSLPVTESCGNEYLPSILSASENNKELTYNFIEGLTSKSEITDHNMGMKIAMKMARLFYAEDETVMLLYIRPGIEFSMSEAMNMIASSDLTSPLIINTCAVSSGSLPDIQDMNMLSDIMNDLRSAKNHLISRGSLIFVNEEHSIGPAVAKFYEVYNKNVHKSTLKTSLPSWDAIAQDLSISFSIGFPLENRFIVIGVDMLCTRFLRDVIYYSHYQKDMYAILMNLQGKVLVHPSISLEKQEKEIKFADISNFIEVNFTREMLFKEQKGAFTSNSTSLNYIWQNINNMYVLCMVVKENEEVPTTPASVNLLPNLANSQLISYLLELAGGSTYCKLQSQVVNLEVASLYLGQSCFQNLLPKSNQSLTLKLLPYLQHETFLLKHEGLQNGIRDELACLIQVTELLQNKHLNSVNSDYIIRRYVATKSGILHIFPGVAIGFGFEPSRRSWFVRADGMRGKLVVSPPYLDAGGAGYIVTISFATPYIVLGIDVTYGYIVKMILYQHEDCMKNSTCFLVDDRGYLISHPDLIASLESDSEPVEQLHIVHKESSVANDLLNHGDFVQKLACNDYTTATIQRYYQFNMSYDDILTTLVLGEPCVSYSISPIGGTNLFFGIVKAACPITRTFCPCSVIDRLCLNCQHMEKQECECPCECPIHRSSCSNYTSHDDYKLCDPALKSYSSDPVFNHDNSEDIQPCPISSCESKSNYLSCLGVIGCEWCKKDTYGFPLDSPYCTTMSSCFNGVLGGPNPYKDTYVENTSLFSSIKNTGFILGLIIVFGILFILIFVCWRTCVNIPRNQRVYLSARQEEQLHMSDLNVNDDFLEQGNHSDKLLIDEKKGTPISPYCVTSNYSRPTTAADSDHGYSTMTPHDESEHLSLAPIEIDSLEEDGASDRTTPPLKRKVQSTKIPIKNCIIVPVMVHRHVDAT